MAITIPIEGSTHFQLGNKEADIHVLGNNIRIDDTLYELGEEEWKLLTLKDPGKLEDHNDKALENYYYILTHTLAFMREDKSKGKSKRSLIWSRGNKYNKIIKFIYRQYMQDESAKQVDEIKKVRESQERRNSVTLGSGLKTIFLPSNLNELVDRHKLLLASYNAGNTGIYNGIQAVNDKLFEKGIFTSQDIISFQKIFCCDFFSY